MGKSQFEVPKSSVMMVSPRDYRLSSLTGFCVTFKADVPIPVPPHVYAEALAIGASLAPDEELPTEPPPLKGVAEAAKLQVEAQEDALHSAVRIVIARNDPQDFKTDGTPKHNVVVAEMDPRFNRPTATEISDAYALLQEDISLAED